MRLTKLLWTHQVMADPTGAESEVVPHDEQNQEEGQHVKLPVPHCHHEHLQAEGHRGRISVRSETRVVGGQNKLLFIKSHSKTFSVGPESLLAKG